MEKSFLDKIKDKSRGLPTKELEKLMLQLLDHLSSREVAWGAGIDQINDLLFLRAHGAIPVDSEICAQILHWIKHNYSNVDLEILAKNDQHESPELLSIQSKFFAALETLFIISAKLDILPFLEERILRSKTDFEQYEFVQLKEALLSEQPKQQELDPLVVDQVMKRVADFFRQENLAQQPLQLKCGLRESLIIYERSYAVDWCLQTEKYFAPHKRRKAIGGGKLFISKENDLIQMAGSSPFEDWEKWFELMIDQEEEYFVLEISYEKAKLAPLKTLLQCSTPQLLSLVDAAAKIRVEKAKFLLERMKRDFDHSGIQSEIKVERRKTISPKTRK